MDTLGIRATAIVFMVCAVMPQRFAMADTSGITEDEMALVAEVALIAELFGDNQEALDWSVAQPGFVSESPSVDRLQLAVVDDISLPIGGCGLPTGVKGIVANGESQPYSSGQVKTVNRVFSVQSYLI